MGVSSRFLYITGYEDLSRRRACWGTRSSLRIGTWPSHATFLLSWLHCRTCGNVLKLSMAGLWPSLEHRPWASHGTFLSHAIYYRTCAVVLNEGMLRTSALAGAQPLTIAHDTPRDFSWFQDVHIWSWWTDAPPFFPSCCSDLGVRRNIIFGSSGLGVYVGVQIV